MTLACKGLETKETKGMFNGKTIRIWCLRKMDKNMYTFRQKLIYIQLNVTVCQHKFICYENNIVATWLKCVLFSVIINLASTESLLLNCGPLTVQGHPLQKWQPIFLSDLKNNLSSNYYSFEKGEGLGKRREYKIVLCSQNEVMNKMVKER